MSKLYFKYGAMGSSKTAQALMCKFNYEQVGYDVTLIKPIIDNRDVDQDKIIVKSRIGLSSPCEVFNQDTNLYKFVFNLNQFKEKAIVIVDECQFCTSEQIDQLKEISYHIPVLCYGLMTNFKTRLFEGSKRLVEIADSLMEIKTVCPCGRKATINARFIDGKLCTDGEEIVIGGDETYRAICYHCYTDLKKELYEEENVTP